MLRFEEVVCHSGDVPRSLIGVDKHCGDVEQRSILKYLRGKLLLPH